ncbi:MAG: pyrimidine 5'-nucleotidase [Betaproteobacteria bacterium]|nr:pyrimidine 5'-nucleotidase [Betaproteobacteria bacterium]
MHLTWIFDLDNTLHNASRHIFPHINRSMTAYLQQQLRLDEGAASALRIHYWKTYGATLVGMMRHHGTDPVHFLSETHQFPELERMMVAEGGLRHALKRLPGKKILYSNAPFNYARSVIEALRIGRFFDAVYTVEHTRFRPKPDPAGLRLLLKAEKLVAGRCVLVEDTLANLRAARRLGLKTAWVTRGSRSPRWVDARVSSVIELPRLTHRFRIR